MRALSSSVLTSAWSGEEALAVIFSRSSFFRAIHSVNDQNSDLAHAVCACVRVWVRASDVCVSARVKLSMHDDVLAARYGLCRPFFGRGMHYQQFIYTLCE